MGMHTATCSHATLYINVNFVSNTKFSCIVLLHACVHVCVLCVSTWCYAYMGDVRIYDYLYTTTYLGFHVLDCTVIDYISY